MSKNISKIKKIYHAAIYLRLSKEDGDVANSKKAESDSISNQRILIQDFLKQHEDIEVVSTRIDDGFSGSSFENRPAFQLMLEDIRHGIVDCVIVKDLSRFGREYIDSGMYIERLFPALGVRFIAINDNIDTARENNQSDEIIIPFKNLINDAYCRDMSVKIRSHLDVKRRSGEFISNYVPYGYEKSEEDRHTLVIDTYAAGVVRDIFKMKLSGMSQDAIANKLNEDGILSPMEYKNSVGCRYRTSFKVNDQAEWSSVTVRRILENEVYIGNLVQGKRTTPNHKVKKVINRPASEWSRVEDTHDAIVSRRDFEIVQRLLGMDTRTSPDNEKVFMLSGITKCADCGAPMVRKSSTVAGKRYEYYICSTHKANKTCSSHRIPVDSLQESVLFVLQQHISNLLDLDRILKYIGTVPFQELDIRKLEERCAKKEEEIAKCKELRVMLYTDYKDGVITKEDYVELHAAYDKKGKEAQEVLTKLRIEIRKILHDKADKYEWIEYFKQHKGIKELTRTVVAELISEIRVTDKNNIEVIFDFNDCYMDALNKVEQYRKQKSSLEVDELDNIMKEAM